jgi:hypothetical protein
MDKKKLTVAVVIRLLVAVPALGLIFFLPAGTFDYWEAWAYLGILFIPMTGMLFYFLKQDPDKDKRLSRVDRTQLYVTPCTLVCC